jgi:hypothetical protein
MNFLHRLRETIMGMTGFPDNPVLEHIFSDRPEKSRTIELRMPPVVMGNRTFYGYSAWFTPTGELLFVNCPLIHLKAESEKHPHEAHYFCGDDNAISTANALLRAGKIKEGLVVIMSMLATYSPDSAFRVARGIATCYLCSRDGNLAVCSWCGRFVCRDHYKMCGWCGDRSCGSEHCKKMVVQTYKYTPPLRDEIAKVLSLCSDHDTSQCKICKLHYISANVERGACNHCRAYKRKLVNEDNDEANISERSSSGAPVATPNPRIELEEFDIRRDGEIRREVIVPQRFRRFVSGRWTYTLEETEDLLPRGPVRSGRSRTQSGPVGGVEPPDEGDGN